MSGTAVKTGIHDELSGIGAPENTREPEASAFDDLYADAVAAIADNGAPDSDWAELVAGLLARAVADLAVADLGKMQTRLRQLLIELSGRRGLRHRDLAAELQALVWVADAGADLARPRILGATLEPRSEQARILALLLERGEVLADDLKTALKVQPSQISRSCKRLADKGLLVRRQYGRKVTWALSETGLEAAYAAVRGPATGTHPEDLSVQASTAAQFNRAVSDGAPLIRITGGASRAKEWHALLVKLRAQRGGPRLLDRAQPPEVVFADDNNAYVNYDLLLSSAAAEAG